MEEGIRKRGLLYLQQQRFGKKWKKVWSVLHRESTCSISRLEFFESKDGGTGTLEKPKAKQENKKVIRMSDCIRVSDADVDGCPKDCRAFLVETTEKIFVFAVETAEHEDWIQKLCEIAFPMNWGERAAARRNSLPTEFSDVSMTQNSLYGGKEAVMKDFKVTMRRTDAADRCCLQGHYLLRTDFDSLLLKDPKTGEVLFTWPYCYLRRFGKDKTTFSFEAGRRCQSGEGNFEFETKLGNNIFQYIEEAINIQKAGLSHQQADQDGVPQPPKLTPPPEDGAATVYSMLNQGGIIERPKHTSPHRSLEMPADKHLTGVKSLNLDMRPQPKKSQVKSFRSCPLVSTEDDDPTYSRVATQAPPVPQERSPKRVEQDEPNRTFHPASRSDDPEYSLPFDNIAKNTMTDILTSSHMAVPTVLEPGVRSAEPLYDSIDESAIRPSCQHRPPKHSNKYTRPEHIYDEPEGRAAAPGVPTALYDDPEEVKGQAWKVQAAGDPSGHEYPYNSQVDDYAVPKPPRRANVPKQEKEEASEDSSPYDNVQRMRDV
ncbi:docking protein 2 [Trichomycterus rosablanca]|uniref:docking protein 2 n=1 Tax=Trichomycterus rosablanca TaxID=2290929 RepID=UPI002F35E294